MLSILELLISLACTFQHCGKKLGHQSAQKQHRRVAVDLICGWSLTKVDVGDTKYLHNGTVLLRNIFCCVELQLQEKPSFLGYMLLAQTGQDRFQHEKIDTLLYTMLWNTSN